MNNASDITVKAEIAELRTQLSETINRMSRTEAAALPRIITNVEELKRASRLVEPLLKQGEARTPEERALCELLLRLIDDYQTAHPVFPPMKPHEILQSLMEEHALRQADLLDVFGSGGRPRRARNQQRTGEEAWRAILPLAGYIHLNG